MKFKEWLLAEGLIQLPTKMFERIENIIHSEVYGCIDRLLKGKKRQFPNHAKFFREFQKSRPTAAQKYDGEDHYYSIPYDLAGLSPKVASAFKASRNFLVLLCDWNNKFNNIIKGEAGYIPTKEVILVKMFPILRYLQSDPSDIEYYINRLLKDILPHELQHMVQYLSLQHLDPRNVEMKPNYAQQGSEYYTSNIEFSPYITSTIEEFRNHIRFSKNVNRDLRIFVGIEKGDILSGIQTHKFFKWLKAISPVKWKKAVKLFYQGIAPYLTKTT